MPPPALVSTITSWPCVTSSRTLAGTSPTRYSWVLISFGTPISIAPAPRPNPGTYPSLVLAPKGSRRQRAGASVLHDANAGHGKPVTIDDLLEGVGAGGRQCSGRVVLVVRPHRVGGQLTCILVDLGQSRTRLVL